MSEYRTTLAGGTTGRPWSARGHPPAAPSPHRERTRGAGRDGGPAAHADAWTVQSTAAGRGAHAGHPPAAAGPHRERTRGAGRDGGPERTRTRGQCKSPDAVVRHVQDGAGASTSTRTEGRGHVDVGGADAGRSTSWGP